MLFRFSLYGFLKNQRYFEPFLILALLEKGLSFFAIGILIAFREIATNVLEIPSGSIADLLGRRRAMQVSFAAYLGSFLMFWQATDQRWLWPAMLLFAIGDAFRTGTHKAMIFAWLQAEGRSNDKTQVYGYTRSWSKLGSATSVVIGTALLFWLDSYAAVFLLSAVPVALNLINLSSYPSYLDGELRTGSRLRDVWQHSRAAMIEGISKPRLRALWIESMSFEGVFHAAKDYLQPLLATAAAVWFTTKSDLAGVDTGSWSDLQRSTLIIAPVYLCLHLMSAFASRRAHQLVAALGNNEQRAASLLWSTYTGVFSGLLIGEITHSMTVSIAAFVLLHALQNLWRPILLTRIDQLTNNQNSAVTLSIESQGRRLATVCFAPIFGLAIDSARAASPDAHGIYWPIAIVGIVVGLVMVCLRRRPSLPT